MSTEERGRRAVVPLAALSALLLVAVVVLAVLASKWHGDASKAKDEKAAGEAALTAARAYLVDFTSYDYKNADKTIAGWPADFTDADVVAPFIKNQSVLVKTIKKSRTVAKGKVEASMSRTISTDQVEVLAAVTQVMRSNAAKGYHVEQQQFSLTMKLVGGTWKIERLEPVGSDDGS